MSMRSHMRYCLLVFYLFLLGPLCPNSSALAFQSTEADFEAWIGELGSDKHAIREQAANALRESGIQAIPALIRAYQSDDPEVRQRVSQILGSMLNSTDDEIYEAALAAFRELANSENNSVANYAKAALRKRNEDIADWITNRIGGTVEFDETSVGRAVVGVTVDYHIAFGNENPEVLSDHNFDRLTELRELKSLKLGQSTKFSDVSMAHLARLKKLERLDLSQSQITGWGFKQLAGHEGLREIELDYCYSLQPKALALLKDLPNLESLSVDAQANAGQSDDGWAQSLRWLARTNGTGNSDLASYRGGLKNSDLEFLADMDLVRLSLRRSKVTGEGLEYLKSQSRLTELVLDYSAVTNEGMQKLRGLENLKSLSLDFTPVSDDGLAHIGQMGQLESLSLNGCAISDQGVPHLTGLNNLQRLNLFYAMLTGESIPSLMELTSIREMNLEKTPLKLKSVVRLAEILPHASTADGLIWAGLVKRDENQIARMAVLRGQGLADDDLKFLKEFPQLMNVDVSGNPITDSGLESFAHLKDLTYLHLNDTKITDEGLKHLSGLELLNGIGIKNTAVTFEGVRDLMRLQNRTVLDAIRIGRYSDQHWRSPEQRLPDRARQWHLDFRRRNLIDADLQALNEIEHIHSIKLPDNERLTNDGIEHLLTHHQLISLWLGGENIDGETLKVINQLRHLMILWLTNANVTNDDLYDLAKLERLEVLNLCGCSIDDEAVDALRQIRGLKTLIIDVKALSEQALAELKREIPGLDVVRSQRNVLRALRGRERQEMRLPQGATRRVVYAGVPSRIVEHPLIEKFGDEYFEVAESLNSVAAIAELHDVSDVATVETLMLVDAEIPKGGLDYLKNFTSLKRLSLYRAAVDDEDLKHVAGMHSLERLELGRSTVTDKGLRNLTTLPSLKSFSIGGNSTSVSDITCIRAMPNLEDLSISRTNISDEDMIDVAYLSNLKRFSARETELTSAGIEKLKELEDLEHVDLSYTLIDDSALEHLLELPKLRMLLLSSTFVTQAGLDRFREKRPKVHVSARGAFSDEQYEIATRLLEQSIRARPNHSGNIVGVTLRGELNAETAEIISGLDSLESVRVLKGPDTNLVFESIASLDKLQQLTISHAEITKEQVELLNAETLNWVRFPNCKLGPGVTELLGDMKQLTLLDLTNSHVNDEDLSKLVGLDLLQTFFASGNEITDAGLDSLTELDQLNRLTLDRTEVTADGLETLSNSNSLKTVSVRDTTISNSDGFPFEVETGKGPSR